MLQKVFKNKNISKKLQLRLKNTITDKTLTYTSETWIFGPVYDNEKENWTILTNRETIRLIILRWFGHVHHRMDENRIPKRGLYMNLGTRRLRGISRNRCKMKCGRMEEQ